MCRLFARVFSLWCPFRAGAHAVTAPHDRRVARHSSSHVGLLRWKTADVGVGLGSRVRDDPYLELAELRGKPRRGPSELGGSRDQWVPRSLTRWWCERLSGDIEQGELAWGLFPGLVRICTERGGHAFAYHTGD